MTSVSLLFSVNVAPLLPHISGGMARRLKPPKLAKRWE